MTDRPVKALGLICRACEAHALPKFAAQVRKRSRSSIRKIPATRKIMDLAVCDIAYSQNAQSDRVSEDLVKTNVLRRAFCNFNHRRIAMQSASSIHRKHWEDIKTIRFKGKIESIVGVARVFVKIDKECGSFREYIREFKIPRRINSIEDLSAFWSGFKALRTDFRRRRVPFFKNTTSLLHLLMDLDFDCLKPDMIVMRLLRRIGVVESETGDPQYRRAVEVIQSYGMRRRIRPGALDWYLIAFGGQRDAGKSLSRSFCPPAGSCANRACPVGKRGLCRDYSK